MTCPKCGGEILNDRCMQCGEPLHAEQTSQEPQQPQPPSYQDYQQSYQQPGYQQAPPPPNIKHPSSTTNMVIGIIQLICCCIVTGILILVWNSNLDTAFRAGNQMEVARLEKNIKIAMIVGFIIPVVIAILYVIGVFALGFSYDMFY